MTTEKFQVLDEYSPIPDGPKGLIPRDYTHQPYGSLPYAAPMDISVIPRSEWGDRIRQKEKDGATLRELCRSAGLEPPHQGNTNYCWANGPTHALEICRLIQGQPLVRLSPASIAAPITGYRNVGGWGVRALEYLVQHGACPAQMWPANAIDRRYDTSASREVRKHYRVTHWYDVVTTQGMSARERFERLVTMLLLGYPCAVAYNWWGHLVCAVDVVLLDGGKYGIFCHNSGAGRDAQGFTTLSESRGAPDECIAPNVAIASAIETGSPAETGARA